MALIVEDGTGLSTAQSLVGVTDADALLALRLHTAAWSTANTATKEAALAWASRMLSRLEWNGVRVSNAQALAFPRSWLRKRDPATATPYLPTDEAYYAEDAVPDFVEEATAVQALRLIERDPLARPDSAGIQSLQAGALSLTYDTQQVAMDRDDTVDREVMDIISFALARSAQRGGSREAVRV